MTPRKALASALGLVLAAASFPGPAAAQVVRALEAAPELPATPSAPLEVPPAPLAAPLEGGEALGGLSAPLSELLPLSQSASQAVSPLARLQSKALSLAQSPLLRRGEEVPTDSEASSAQSTDLFRRLVDAPAGAPETLELEGLPALQVAPNPEGPLSLLFRLARLSRRPGPEAPPPGRGRVLPDKEANGSYWRLLISQEFTNASQWVHVVALPGIMPNLATRGYLRIAHYGSQAVSSFATGPWVDRVSNKKSIVWNSVGLAAVLGLIPLASHLLPSGSAGFVAALAGITIGRAFFQVFAINSAQAMNQKIVSPYPEALSRANAIRVLIDGVVAMGASYGAGKLIEHLTKSAGAVGASAWAYGVAAAFALGSAAYTALFVKEPKAKDEAAAFKNRSAGARLGDYGEGFKIIAKSPFLRGSILVGLVEMLATDPFMLLVLPGFVGRFGSGGGFGTVMAAASLGSTAAGLAMIAWQARKSKDDPLKRNERDGRLSYLLSAAGALLTWGLYFSGGVWTAAVFYGLSTLLTSPSTIVWQSLIQQILKDREADAGKVYSAISVLWPATTVLGTLVFPLVVRGMSPSGSMALFSVLFTISAALHAWGALKLFPLKEGRPPAAPPGGPKTASVPRLAWTAGLA